MQSGLAAKPSFKTFEENSRNHCKIATGKSHNQIFPFFGCKCGPQTPRDVCAETEEKTVKKGNSFAIIGLSLFFLLQETPCLLSVHWFVCHVFYPIVCNGFPLFAAMWAVSGCSQTVAVAWLNQSASAVAWVTRPERPKGVKDIIKQARRAAT